MTETAHIIGGDLIATSEDRVVAGMLLPFNVEGSTNLGKFTVEPGVVEVPKDVSHLFVNEGHSQMDPRGRFLAAEETSEGITARFHIAETPQGDALLAEIQAKREIGKPMALSAEVKDVLIRSGKAISGLLTGAAFVERGAFPGAALLAAAVDTPVDPNAPVETVVVDGQELPAQSESTSSFTETSSTGADMATEETVVEEVEDLGDGTKRITKTITTTTTITEPTADQTTQENTMTTPAAVPTQLLAASTKKDMSASEVFDSVARLMKGEDSAGSLLAALSDIKTSGSGQLPVGGSAIQPSWLGEVFSEKAYQRRYMNLIRQGNITAIDEKGFRVATGSEAVQAWAGNKAEMPTMTGTTSAVTSVFQRWGVANDIAREFYDIPAGRAVIEAYFRLLVNSYSRVTDYWTLSQLATAAGAQVDAETFPVGYDVAFGKVLQAIDLVDETDAEPTSVVVAADVWKALRYTPKDLIPEYVTFSLNRTDGVADGSVLVLKDKSGTLEAGQVLGISKEAAHVNELPGAAPMTLDALDIAHGGIDKAVLGYTQFMAEAPEGLVLIGDAAI